MSRVENDLAKLILENNYRNGINSNGPIPNITLNINNNNNNSSKTLNIINNSSNNNNNNNNNNGNCKTNFNVVPSIIVSDDSIDSGNNVKKDEFFNLNNSDDNNNNNNNFCKEKEKEIEKENLKDSYKKNNSENIYDRKVLDQHTKQANNIEYKEKREPSNLLIFENIDINKSQLVRSLVEDQNLNFSFSVQLVRYLSYSKSLMLVFSHKNEAELCKLLVSKQDSFKLDDDTIVYFGKDTPLQLINKCQLKTPFPKRQYLISPPMSPPNEWCAPGDGMEQPPSDIDPFAEVTTITVTDICNNNNNNKSNNNKNHSQAVLNSNDSKMCCDDNEDNIQRSFKKVIYQDNTTNNFPSITLEFCT